MLYKRATTFVEVNNFVHKDEKYNPTNIPPIQVQLNVWSLEAVYFYVARILVQTRHFNLYFGKNDIFVRRIIIKGYPKGL